MEAEIHYTRLGSIFPDLPFYTNIVPMTLGYWLERPAEVVPIASRMHSDSPDRFSWHLLETLARGEAPGAREMNASQRLALMAGYFSHVALDLEIHGLVNWCARRDTLRYGGHESHHHRLTEKYHSLFFHIDHDGHDCLGRRSFFSERSKVLDQPAFVRLQREHPAARFTSHVLGFYREHQPSVERVASWLRTFRHFTFLVSIPAAKRNGDRLGHAGNRYRYYDNEDFSFDEYWQRGYTRSIEMLTLAYDVVRGGDLGDGAQREFLDKANILDLAYPPAPDLPPLPAPGAALPAQSEPALAFSGR